MIFTTSLLLILGIAVIYSSSPEQAILQAIYTAVGMVCYYFLSRFDYRSLKSLIKPTYILIILFLVITLILGIETRGSVRWIPLGPFNFQPSEFAKPVMILALAAFWSKNLPTWRNIFKSILILAPIWLMIFRQPDLGTALTIGFIWMGMLIASNVSFFKILVLSSVGAIMAPVVWLFLKDYQKQRVFSFLSPTQDPQGIGFHVIQSMIAVGSGQFFGRGLGRGTQSRLQFLPEFRTDFIFAFIAEELGFIGSAMIIVLYSLLFLFCFRILNRAGDRFGELIITGVMAMLFFQIVVNIGMNIGLLPITGITLPLLSYGGSSIITTLISLGLIASVSRFGMKRKKINIFEFT